MMAVFVFAFVGSGATNDAGLQHDCSFLSDERVNNESLQFRMINESPK